MVNCQWLIVNARRTDAELIVDKMLEDEKKMRC